MIRWGASVIAGAVISPCGRFRYRLWRQWGCGSRLVFVMLNPSTADASEDDPTIRKCMGFARRFGYEGVEVVNLFAYRATDPADLRRAAWPIGPDNDRHIAAALTQASVAVCAWGGEASTRVVRIAEVFDILDRHGVQSMALRINKDGAPAHPLYLPYSSELKPLRPIR